MAVIKPNEVHPIDGRFILLCGLVLMALNVSFARVTDSFQFPISCEHHEGSFSTDFSIDFDINRVDCRMSWVRKSPTFHFWSVSP